MKQIAIMPSTVGFHWEEVYAAYAEFKKAHWEIKFYTVEGKPAQADPKSLEIKPFFSLFGLGANKNISPETESGKELMYKLTHEVAPIETINVDNLDAMYIPGGHGCLFDVNVNTELHKKILQAYQQGKILSAVCHGTSCFAFVIDNGKSIIAGKKVTGFPDLLDSTLEKIGLIDSKFLPMPYPNEKTMQDAGAVISMKDSMLSNLNSAYCVTDLPFITGAGPKAAKYVARKVIQACS